MRTGETKYDCDVLIVDDDEFNLVVAADILREEFSVYPVSSGQTAGGKIFPLSFLPRITNRKRRKNVLCWGRPIL